MNPFFIQWPEWFHVYFQQFWVFWLVIALVFLSLFNLFLLLYIRRFLENLVHLGTVKPKRGRGRPPGSGKKKKKVEEPVKGEGFAKRALQWLRDRGSSYE